MSEFDPLALNIQTFINLYGYGYRNVYELGDVVDAGVADKSENSPRRVAPLIVEDGCRCHVRHSASVSELVGQTGEQRTPPARCT